MSQNQQDQIPALILSQNWEALKNHIDIVSIGELNAQSHFAKGFLLAFGPAPQRNLKEAINCLEIAQQLDPDNIQYLNTLSEAYLQSKRFSLALYAATKSNDLVPGNLFSLIALGRAAWFCGEQRLALDSFAAADCLVPSGRSALKSHLSAITFVASFWQESRNGKSIALVRMEPKHRDFLMSCRMLLVVETIRLACVTSPSSSG